MALNAIILRRSDLPYRRASLVKKNRPNETPLVGQNSDHLAYLASLWIKPSFFTMPASAACLGEKSWLQRLDKSYLLALGGQDSRLENQTVSMQLLSTIEDVFEVPNSTGLVIAPGIPLGGTKKWKIVQGTELLLKTPDGTTYGTFVGGYVRLRPFNPNMAPIMLGPGFSKDMLPVGTEVWVDKTAAR